MTNRTATWVTLLGCSLAIIVVVYATYQIVSSITAPHYTSILCPDIPPFEVRKVSKHPDIERLIIIDMNYDFYLLPIECKVQADD